MDILTQLKQEVFRRRSALEEIYQNFGSLSLFDYAQTWRVSDPGKELSVFLPVVEKLLSQSYGPELAQKAAAQLAAVPLVSTIDHHGILNHPFFINSNLIFSQKNNFEYLICLTTAGVSLNNSSWPGCLLLTAPGGGLERFSFFPDKIKTQAVLASPAIGHKKTLQVLEKLTAAVGVELEAVKKLAEAVFADEGIYGLKNFSSQAAVISSRLWQEIFPSAPRIVYLPVEDVVGKILIDQIITKPEHLLHQLFFTAAGWQLVEKYFSGSLGAFSSVHKGSFLFWGLDNKGRRLHLQRAGDRLVGEEFTLSANPNSIAEALAAKRAYPTTLVCFLALLYYGVTCLGGFNQVDWLSAIRDKFAALLNELGKNSAATAVLGAFTQNFAEGNLAFLPRGDGFIKATGLDIFFTGKDLYASFRELAKTITVGQSIESLLPEIYKIVTESAEQKSALLNITDEQIIKTKNFQSKLRQYL